MEVLDNFLPQEEYESVYHSMMTNKFPWYINQGPVDANKVEDYQAYQFFNIMFNQFEGKGPEFEIAARLLNYVQPYQLLRVKANLTPYSGATSYEHGMHCDVNTDIIKGSKTAVYYVNTNNGYTRFEDTGEKVESIANRLCIFDADRKHTGSTPTNNKQRVVINLNYF